MKENTGKTKYVLLGLLAHSPQTGYSIKKSIEYEYSHFWQESYGQIYPTLKTLENEGLAICTEDSGKSNGRGQKNYSITEAGMAELKKWLIEAPDTEKLRYEILLKVSFGNNIPPEITVSHLDEFIKRNNKLVSEMDMFLDILKSLREEGDDHTYNELTALCGKYIYTAMIDWAEDAKRIITERKVDKNETTNS